MERCCGACRWWNETKHDNALGFCVVPIPEWALKYAPRGYNMVRNEGTDCPCFERKEA